MVLDNEFNIYFNLKKIKRLMKKFGLKCLIRQANPYRRMMKATQEHTTCEILINKVFKTGIPYNVLLLILPIYSMEIIKNVIYRQLKIPKQTKYLLIM